MGDEQPHEGAQEVANGQGSEWDAATGPGSSHAMLRVASKMRIGKTGDDAVCVWTEQNRR